MRKNKNESRELEEKSQSKDTRIRKKESELTTNKKVIEDMKDFLFSKARNRTSTGLTADVVSKAQYDYFLGIKEGDALLKPTRDDVDFGDAPRIILKWSNIVKAFNSIKKKGATSSGFQFDIFKRIFDSDADMVESNDTQLLYSTPVTYLQKLLHQQKD